MPTMAVVGAEIASLTVARELLRCGFTNVHIYEATDRIGGRHYTVLNTTDRQFTPIELGAMRFPPFLPPGTMDINDGCSLLSYYFKIFELTGQGFPNPGSAYADTGIYYNEGYLSSATEPMTAIWKKGAQEPPELAIKNIHDKWKNFANGIINVVSQKYVDQKEWPIFWHKIVDNYWRKTFRDVVLDPVKSYSESDPGNFGGAGMTENEANLFY